MGFFLVFLDYQNPIFTGIYRNLVLITENQLHYQVCHDLCKFRHIDVYCQLIYKQIICPSLEEYFGITTILFTFL